MIIDFLRCVYILKKKVVNICYGYNKKYASDNIIESTIDDTAIELAWEVTVPQNTIMFEQLTREWQGDVLRNYKVWYSGERYVRPTPTDVISYIETPIVKPWVWIGGDDICKGSMVDPFLIYGNTIRLELLQHLDPSVKHWSYIDSETFITTVFPADGIIIKAR